MLFVAEYEVAWESLETAVAKRLEWDAVCPDDFRFVAEYVWPDSPAPFRGIAVFEAGSVDAVNSFRLHYGATLHMRIHPASDVVSAIGRLAGASPPAEDQRRRQTRAR